MAAALPNIDLEDPAAYAPGSEAPSGGGAPMVVQPQLAQLPAEVDHTAHTSTMEGPSDSTTTTTPSELSQAGIEGSHAALDAEDANAANQYKIDAQKAAIEEAKAEQKRVADEAALAARQQRAAQHEQAKAAEKAETDRAAAEMAKAAKPTTFWEDKGEPARILAALVVGLGQFSASMSGGRNGAEDTINTAIDRDRQAKMDKFARSKEYVDLLRTNRLDAAAAWDDQERRNDAMDKAKLDLIDKSAAAAAAKIGTPEAQQKAAVQMAATQAKRGEIDQKAGERLDQKNTHNTGHTGTSDTHAHTTNTPVDAGMSKPDPLAVPFLDGSPGGRAPDAKRAQALQAMFTDANKLNRATRAMEAHIAKNGGFLNPLTQQPQIREREVLKGTITGLQSNINNNSGVVNGGERPIFNKPQDPGLWESIYNGKEDGSKALKQIRDLAAGGFKDSRASMQLPRDPPKPGAAPAAAPKGDTTMTNSAPRAAAKPAEVAPKSQEAKVKITAAKMWLRDNPKADKEQRDRVMSRIRELGGR